MTDTNEKSVYFVTDGTDLYVHTNSKNALHRIDTTPGATLNRVIDGTRINHLISTPGQQE